MEGSARRKPVEYGYNENLCALMRDDMVTGKTYSSLGEEGGDGSLATLPTVRPHSSLGYRTRASETASPPSPAAGSFCSLPVRFALPVPGWRMRA